LGGVAKAEHGGVLGEEDSTGGPDGIARNMGRKARQKEGAELGSSREGELGFLPAGNGGCCIDQLRENVITFLTLAKATDVPSKVLNLRLSLLAIEVCKSYEQL